jgi:hypothetical protein
VVILDALLGRLGPHDEGGVDVLAGQLAWRGPRLTHSTSAARKWRAKNRIERTLFDGEPRYNPNLRPSPATPPYHTKCQMFLSTAKGRNPD